MAVALELLVFKVQRLVTHRRSLPHISGLLPATANVPAAIVNRALEGKIFPLGALDADIELHFIHRVRSQVLKTLLARFFSLRAISRQRGITLCLRRRRLIWTRPAR